MDTLPGVLSAVILVLLALAGAAVLLATRSGSTSGKLPTDRNAERSWEQKILSQTLGNRGAMERAVTARRRKHPRASRAALLEMVHEEYVRDRNRS